MYQIKTNIRACINKAVRNKKVTLVTDYIIIVKIALALCDILVCDRLISFDRDNIRFVFSVFDDLCCGS